MKVRLKIMRKILFEALLFAVLIVVIVTIISVFVGKWPLINIGGIGIVSFIYFFVFRLFVTLVRRRSDMGKVSDLQQVFNKHQELPHTLSEIYDKHERKGRDDTKPTDRRNN
ncbi:hypothetical protein [Sporolactobacillus pectinivorans]|uniref:hypothetical protein n=1 Tax=Sporolactobacillus pectinivorans TaxID=1591408 RepID=UPI000C260BD2|nr:hypothetical protein [Sporolactobacillus pectinivorans]